ncbi:MAG: ASKHA domain-containing protein [Dehalococcoidia bacterium]
MTTAHMGESQPDKTSMFSLHVLPQDIWLHVPKGITVYQALEENGIDTGGECGGLGKCGKCRMKVLTTLGPPTRAERELLTEELLKEGVRLACRTEVHKDLTISLEESEVDTGNYQILAVGHRPVFKLDPLVHKRLITMNPVKQDEWVSQTDRVKMLLGAEYENLKPTFHCLQAIPKKLEKTRYSGAAVIHEDYLLDWQGWKRGHSNYGMAFDIGTTTVVGKLINLDDGTELSVASCQNSQSRHGTNLISRFQYITENRHGLRNLQNLMISDMNEIIARLLKPVGLTSNDIYVAVAAGNTTMQHIALGVDPSRIAESPFLPVYTEGLVIKAADAGFDLHPEALFYMMPMKSGYIGGDLLSVILASGAAEQEDEMVLGIDLGTNAEIFLGNRQGFMACSAAAGPALEGARISSGMIASRGAIEAVRFEDGEIVYDVIGNVKPKGLCGSGLVDLIAVLLQIKIIDNEGLVCSPPGELGDKICSRIVEESGVKHFLIASAEESGTGKPLYLTQKDVRELQLAKGAIAAGTNTLRVEMGLDSSGIDRLYLAGALGNYVNPASAMRIGLIPSLEPRVVSSLGNAASTGASMALLSKSHWHKINLLSDSIKHIELSSRADFNDSFIDFMDFPDVNSRNAR